MIDEDGKQQIEQSDVAPGLLYTCKYLLMDIASFSNVTEIRKISYYEYSSAESSTTENNWNRALVMSQKEFNTKTLW